MSWRTIALSHAALAGILAGVLVMGGCKEEKKTTETTVTKPADEAPAKVEEKTTTEEKQ